MAGYRFPDIKRQRIPLLTGAKEEKALKSYTVKELMVPLAEYATVSRNASLFEAVSALEKAQEAFDRDRYRHRAILILNDDGQVVGKMGQLDVLRALEPKYAEMLDDPLQHHRYGFSKKFMMSILSQYNMWETPLEDICRKAGQRTVARFMHTPTEGEYISETATLDAAVHQLVMGNHQSLLVTGDQGITGILRLTDVFAAVFQTMKSCKE